MKAISPAFFAPSEPEATKSMSLKPGWKRQTRFTARSDGRRSLIWQPRLQHLLRSAAVRARLRSPQHQDRDAESVAGSQSNSSKAPLEMGNDREFFSLCRIRILAAHRCDHFDDKRAGRGAQ